MNGMALKGTFKAAEAEKARASGLMRDSRPGLWLHRVPRGQRVLRPGRLREQGRYQDSIYSVYSGYSTVIQSMNHDES